MRFYFNRKMGDVIPKDLHLSYESFCAGLVSALYYFLFDIPRVRIISTLLIFLFMGSCAFITLENLLDERKKNDSCNVYDLLRCIACIALIIIVIFGYV